MRTLTKCISPLFSTIVHIRGSNPVPSQNPNS